MKAAVLGGGVVGLFCAHYLQRFGVEVVLAEKGRVGGGCSYGNAGWIVPSLSTPLPNPGVRRNVLRLMIDRESPLYLKPSAVPAMLGWLWRFWRHCNEEDFLRGARALAALNERTLPLWREVRDDVPGVTVHEDGLVLAFRTRHAIREERQTLAFLGYGPEDARELSPAELVELEPVLGEAPQDFAGGFYVRSDGHVRPDAVCEALARHLRGRGVEIVEELDVREPVVEGRRVRAWRVTRAGSPWPDLEADVSVIAAGAESGRLAKSCGDRLPIQAGKGYSVTFDAPRRPLRRPLYLSAAKIALTPIDGALRLSGTLELSGINRVFDRRRMAAIRAVAERQLPGILTGGSCREWVGMRPLTPDGLPVVGRLPAAENVFVASGHQMLGVTLAPASGLALAELIAEGRSSIDLEPFDPGRFGHVRQVRQTRPAQSSFR